MDPVPSDVRREPVRESAAASATREHRHWARPEPHVVQEGSHLRLEKPGEIRLRLQRGAPANLRHHVRRALVRFTVLLVSDLASFAVMWALVRAVRDYAVVGDALAVRFEALLPAGVLDGWQYAAGVV